MKKSTFEKFGTCLYIPIKFVLSVEQKGWWCQASYSCLSAPQIINPLNIFAINEFHKTRLSMKDVTQRGLFISSIRQTYIIWVQLVSVVSPVLFTCKPRKIKRTGIVFSIFVKTKILIKFFDIQKITSYHIFWVRTFIGKSQSY